MTGAPPQNISSNQKIPTSLKLVLEQLTAFSFILKSKIYSIYLEKVSATTKQTDFEGQGTVSQTVADQLTSLSSLANVLGRQPAPLLVKTVSQLEKENNPLDQNSTASDSPSNFVTTSLPQQLNIEELSQKLLQESSKGTKNTKSPRNCSTEDSSDEAKTKIIEDSVSSHGRRSPTQTSNDAQDQVFVVYDGFIVGDLGVDFNPIDAYLFEPSEDITEQDDSEGYELSGVTYNYYDDEEEEENSAMYRNERVELMNQANAKGGEEEKIDYQHNSNDLSFQGNSYPSSMMSLNSVYNQPQSFYNNQGYYPYYYDQNSPLTSYSFGNSVPYMDRPKTTEPTMTEPIYPAANYYNEESAKYSKFDTRPQRKRSFESNSSYLGAEEDYSTHHTYGSYNQNGYQKPNAQGSIDNEKGYYYGNNKARYEMKAKLPPRLQKKRDNFYRN